MGQYQEFALQKSTSYRSNRTIISPIPEDTEVHDFNNYSFLFHHNRKPPPSSSVSSTSSSALTRMNKVNARISSIIRSFCNIVTFPHNLLNIPTTTCKWLALPSSTGNISVASSASLGRKITGTLFGHRRGHVSFSVQDDSRSDPVLVLELAMSTSTLVREMSSGLVRIALECEKVSTRGSQTGRQVKKLFNEPVWSMYCNGKKCGYAVSRTCTESDWHVLRTVERVTVGAGVIPVVEDAQKSSGTELGELLYMRAKFERVVGSRDSEAFYMLNPDNNGGPELSIFLLRI